MADSTVKVIFLGDSKDLKKALDDVDDASEKTSSHFADFGKKAALGLGSIGVGAGAAFIHFGQLGLQLESMGKKTQTVFEGATADVKAWADANAKSMGLTDDKLEQLAASFGDLLKPMGFTAQQAASMSKDVVGLSGALSAWSGGQRSAAEVSEILAKAMLGERDGLKELGISITEADVSARLAAKGQQDLTGAALEQAKALATQELIFEKSADAQKAWADGSMAAIQSQNSLRSSMGELQEQLATRLAPAFAALIEFVTTRVIPAFDSFAAWVRENWPQIRQTIEDVMTRVREVITTVLETIQRFWGTWGDEIMLVVRTVFDFIRTWIESTLTIIRGIVNVIMGLIHGDFSQVWEGIKQIFGGALQYIHGLVDAAMGLLQATISAGMTIIAGIFDAAWDALKRMVSGAWETMKNVTVGAVNDIIGFFDRLGGAIFGFAQNFGKFISGFASQMAEWLVSVWQWGEQVVTWFRELPNRIGSFFAGLGDMILEPFRWAFNEIKSVWNSTVGGFGFTTPDWIPGIGGKGFHIPNMAEGGIALARPGGTIARIGEAGQPEAIVPLDRLKSMIGGGSGGGGNVINIYIGKVNAESPGAVNNMAASMSRELAVALRGSVA